MAARLLSSKTVTGELGIDQSSLSKLIRRIKDKDDSFNPVQLKIAKKGRRAPYFFTVQQFEILKKHSKKYQDRING